MLKNIEDYIIDITYLDSIKKNLSKKMIVKMNLLKPVLSMMILLDITFTIFSIPLMQEKWPMEISTNFSNIRGCSWDTVMQVHTLLTLKWWQVKETNSKSFLWIKKNTETMKNSKIGWLDQRISKLTLNNSVLNSDIDKSLQNMLL